MKNVSIFIVVFFAYLFSYGQPGFLDPGFGTGGFAITSLSTPVTWMGIVAQRDGKLVTCGHTADASNVVVARWLRDGSPDMSFSDDGVVITSFGGSLNFGHCIALQEDGKIVVGGTSFLNNNYDFGVLRFNTDGTPDTGFSGDGRQTVHLSFSDVGNAIAIQKDGKIVLGGYSIGINNDFILLRFNSDGSLDNSFSGDGIEKDDLIPGYPPGEEAIRSIVIQEDGKIIAGGTNRYSFPSTEIVIVRYKANGSKDSSFSGDGIAVLDLTDSEESLESVKLQPDGKILVSGGTRDKVSSKTSALIARLLPDGSRDISFSDDGFLLDDVGGLQGNSTAILYHLNGKIIVSGRTLNGSIFIARYQQDGQPDAGFGTNGRTITAIMATINTRAMVLSQDHLYVAGNINIEAGKGIIAAYRLEPCAINVFSTVLYPDCSSRFGSVTLMATGGTAPYTGTGSFTLQDSISIFFVEDAAGCALTPPPIIVQPLAPLKWYRDSDGDGYGDAANTVEDCFQPAGYIGKALDCNDSDASIHPDAAELCDGKDNNCNGQTDEGITKTIYYQDRDGDGYGNVLQFLQACTPPQGYVLNNTDCDDNKPSVHPGATEICDNGIDDNCNGVTDEGCNTVPTVCINDVTVYESQGKAVLTLTLSHSTTERVRVTINTREATATEKGKDRDYKGHTAHVDFEPGTVSATAEIVIIQDKLNEGEEYFDVVLSKPVNAVLCNKTGRVTLLDGAVLTKAKTGEGIGEGVSLTVLPNPSSGSFTLLWQSSHSEAVQLRVMDMSGRIVEQFGQLSSSQSLQIGQQYRPGTYIVELLQGSERKQLKLVKQPD